jgi:hypothetical protein
MDRPRRDSPQHNGITLRGLPQPTFATKSANSRSRGDQKPSKPGILFKQGANPRRGVRQPKVKVHPLEGHPQVAEERRRQIRQPKVKAHQGGLARFARVGS